MEAYVFCCVVIGAHKKITIPWVSEWTISRQIMSKHGRLCVDINPATRIQLSTSADTFVEVIDRVVDSVGKSKLLACKRNLNRCKEERYLGYPLVSEKLSDYSTALVKYKKALKKSRHNLYVNTCSNDNQKAKLLSEILDELHIHWNISII